MKKQLLTKTLFAIFALSAPFTSGSVMAQEDDNKLISFGEPTFFRHYDKRGVNMFETTKKDYDKPFEGRKIYIGAGFTQQFQTLKHENLGALNSSFNSTTPGERANALAPIKPGFMTAQANLNIDLQLADGIRLNLTNYLSSRHHNEVWVKGGYMQFDKLPFSGDLWDNIMRYTTIKVGHMEINYGDAHFRRPDGGQTMYSPFMEGNIMDAFATEIGGEIYVQKDGVFGMIGLTNGMIKGSVDSLAINTDGTNKANPSLYFKGGIDKQLNESTRLRFSTSWYHNGGTNGSGLTLYSGDRTGSNYQYVMEQYYSGNGTAEKTPQQMYSSGRFNPNFSGKLDAVMLNAFVKVNGFEVFGTYEIAKGYAKNETVNTEGKVDSRQANQFAIEGLYRFGTSENLYAGLRYNKVSSDLTGYDEKVDIDRFALGAGWFLTKNVLLKGEYVKQNYKNFKNSDYRHNGKFDGLVIEAVVGF